MRRLTMFSRATLCSVALAAMLYGCAGLDAPPDTRVDDGVKDFIKVEELTEVDVIRRRDDIRLHSLSDHFVIAKVRQANYLIAYRSRCRDLPNREVTPDYRHEGNTIRARFDTLRGCHIDEIYTISEAQADELKQLGDARDQ